MNQILHVSFTPTDTIDFTSATSQITININPLTLSAALIGDPTKTYDGTTAATLTPANFQITGLIGSDSFTVTQTAGAYDSKDTNAATVTATLSASNFSAGTGTLAGDYLFPTTAGGVGTISAKTLTAAILGTPTKTYDGAASATLTPANFQLTGLVGSESFTITQTAGAFNSKDTNAATTVTATLSAEQLHGGHGHALQADYVLPTTASGAGTISAKTLMAALIGDPAKTYDGTTAALLTPADFQVNGLVGSETFTVTQTVGTYDSKDTTAATVNATLSVSNFHADPAPGRWPATTRCRHTPAAPARSRPRR